ncbi:hypothetical protein [Brevundimonas sp. NIBR11]|uniref:hypothetical protein n=1 Tax=Brevundimonas sp. NIBR11 TaxID=3015999 RepID=UPI0022F12D47|nr:hypothetical protein [Brevundimonas sp. NIBR11]WGM29905.1 hypothetical protein KKHFBJBL_00118 [Brevundimonas sp. NIBR11]
MLAVLDYCITAPGRLAVWLRWAMPTSRYFHDDEARDDPWWRWSLSGTFYAGLYGAADAGLFEGLWAHIALAFASR